MGVVTMARMTKAAPFQLDAPHAATVDVLVGESLYSGA